MKRVLAVVLALVMVLSLTACGGGISTGKYKLTSMKMGETDLVQLYKDMGMDTGDLGTLEIVDDKNATLGIEGEDAEKLTYDGSYFYSASNPDEKIKYKASGSKITLTYDEEDGSVEMVFEK
ncbi:MAG: hypothetical protein J5522_01340 [Lachnospiraceae bacterium]|nr:hypothetical protein [Lachnospiraceae bacterium]MBR4816645.1 hypothetical protein [Lachnospiraceae bacterium]